MVESARYDVAKVDRGSATIDGSCDDAPWPGIAPLSPMSVLGDPQTAAPVATVVRACYDDARLYLHYHCVDSKIISTMTQRDDNLWQEDVVEAFICPDGELGRYFEFNFSPRGVVFDAKITNPDRKKGPGFNGDVAWDAKGVQVGATGEGKFFGNADVDKWWSVEAAIPFADLGVSTPSDGDAWRINLFRIEYETGLVGMPWSAMPLTKGGFHQSDCFGTFTFRR